MRRSLFLTTPFLFASAAAAQVTPEDVWANTSLFYQAFGGFVDATLTTDGAVTQITDMKALWQLPIGAGYLTLSRSDATMTDLGDGTVRWDYPADALIEIEAMLSPTRMLSVGLRTTGDAWSVIASGTPGAVTYSYSYDEIGLAVEYARLTDLERGGGSFDLLQEFGELDFALTLTATGNSGSYTVTDGDVISLRAEDRSATAGYALLAQGITDRTDSSGQFTDLAAAFELDMPKGGAALMNLSGALREGMRFDYADSYASNVGSDKTIRVDQVLTSSSYTSGAGATRFSLNPEGFAAGAKVAAINFDVMDPEIGLPLRGAMELLDAAMSVPVLASDDPQPFDLKIDLGGISMDEAIWALFDPGAALPRDASDISLALSGEMGTTMDMLDLMAWGGVEYADPFPFSIHALTLEALRVASIGAEVTGTGTFTFDMTDLDTFDGLPAPTGTLDVSATGVNGLIDKLIAMGLLPQDQAMMGRMMMGMFAKPVGEDALQSTIEIDGATGAILANGQRLQ